MVFLNEAEIPLSRRAQPQLSPLPSAEQKRQLDVFKLRLHEEILRSQRRNYTFSLIRLAVGSEQNAKDESSEFLELLRSIIREYDILCSVKQGEYAIAFPETTGETANQIAARLKESVLQKFWAKTVSDALEPLIGIACFPKDGTTAEDLLKSAERELYGARMIK
jgi:diguanylate cyclase (GGDEF)-like protein